jgi:hypothetical protein
MSVPTAITRKCQPVLGYALRANPTYGSQPEAEVGAGFGEQA